MSQPLAEGARIRTLINFDGSPRKGTVRHVGRVYAYVDLDYRVVNGSCEVEVLPHEIEMLPEGEADGE